MSTTDQTELCNVIMEHCRIRNTFLKSKNAIINRTASSIATVIGYHSGMEEADRKKQYNMARDFVVKRIAGKDAKMEMEVSDRQHNAIESLVGGVMGSAQAFTEQENVYKKELTKLGRELEIWERWAMDVRGISEFGLAIVVGEIGSLDNYPNPAKVWKRMGCAPYEKDGKVQAASTWRSKGGLKSEDWEILGYSPRRRSVVYNLAASIIKSNPKDSGSPFRARYDEAKELGLEKHPDWSLGHAHNHGMLLCGKRFLRELWINWTQPEPGLSPSADVSEPVVTTTEKVPFAVTEELSLK
jgi:hypothetical protein